MQRIIRILIALDNFVFSLVTFGGAWPGESFSSAAYRSEWMGGTYGKYARPAIDWLFRVLFGQHDHCQKAYRSARQNLPEDMR